MQSEPPVLCAQAVPVTALSRGVGHRATEDFVIEETPVAVICNGISQAVMLASPSDLEDFGIGFAMTEGLIHSLAELRDVEVVAVCQGIEVRLTIGTGAMARLKARRRSLSGKTGCGLCGVESLDDAMRPVRSQHMNPCQPKIDLDAIARVCEDLNRRQQLHRQTGAAHAAGFASRTGELLALREDVGRHNALDKLLGMLASERRPLTDGFVLLTSRASYEIVQKAAVFGCPLLAALLAPTALAIRIARESGMTLVGFAGRGIATIYAHPARCDERPSSVQTCGSAAAAGTFAGLLASHASQAATP